MFSLLKRKPQNQNSREALKKVKPIVAPSQLTVLRAIASLGPCYYRDISRKIGTIDGCVTPRIAELKRKGMIKVAYVATAPSGTKASYYQITGKGYKYMFNILEEN